MSNPEPLDPSQLGRHRMGARGAPGSSRRRQATALSRVRRGLRACGRPPRPCCSARVRAAGHRRSPPCRDARSGRSRRSRRPRRRSPRGRARRRRTRIDAVDRDRDRRDTLVEAGSVSVMPWIVRPRMRVEAVDQPRDEAPFIRRRSPASPATSSTAAGLRRSARRTGGRHRAGTRSRQASPRSIRSRGARSRSGRVAGRTLNAGSESRTSALPYSAPRCGPNHL